MKHQGGKAVLFLRDDSSVANSSQRHRLVSYAPLPANQLAASVWRWRSRGRWPKFQPHPCRRLGSILSSAEHRAGYVLELALPVPKPLYTELFLRLERPLASPVPTRPKIIFSVCTAAIVSPPCPIWVDIVEKLGLGLSPIFLSLADAFSRKRHGGPRQHGERRARNRT